MNYYEMLLARKLAKGELPPNAYLLKTASGSLVSFDDGADLPMPSFICNITANQDLHGYDSPWVGGAGKNKFDQDTVYNSYKQSDGSFRITGNLALIIKNYIPQSLVGQQVTVSVYFDLTKETSPTRVRITCNVGGTETESIRIEENEKKTVSLTFTPTASTDYWYINYGSLGNNYFTFKDCQLEVSSTATSYEPYSNICPISGHTGLDAWVRGKNLLQNTQTTQEINGVTFTVNSDGSVTANGTATARAQFVIPIDTSTVYGDLYFVGCSGGSDNTYNVYMWNSTTNSRVKKWDDTTNSENSVNGTLQEIKIVQGNTVNMFLRIAPGQTVENVTFYPMICSSTETDATYEPYNPNSQTIQVSWQTEAGEVFGGYVDLVSGVLTVTDGFVTFDGSNDENWMKHSTLASWFHIDNSLPNVYLDNDKNDFAKCNMYKQHTYTNVVQLTNGEFAIGDLIQRSRLAVKNTNYENVNDFKTALTTQNLQLKYKLATPQTYQLTPTQIKSLLGTNNAWCSTGDVTLEYFGKGDA